MHEVYIAKKSLELNLINFQYIASSKQGDDFDWLWNSHAIPSPNNGPSFDHTLGTENGHYVYVESTSLNLGGEKAWYVSER